MNPPYNKSLRLSTPPSVPVERLRRHLGVPPDAPFSPREQTLVQGAQSWFEKHGDPWLVACEIPVSAIDGDTVELATGHQLSSEMLAVGFGEAAVDALIVSAFSAGRLVDQAIAEHWRAGHPDEAMFLNAYAIAFVEHARRTAAVDWAAQASERQRVLLPRYSPGYEGWDLADQAVLFELISDTEEFRSQPDPPLDLLSQGGLRPTKATLTIHGLTSREDLRGTLDKWWQRLATRIASERQNVVASPSVDCDPEYALPVQALRKWAERRLQVDERADGQMEATFRFSGTTCANMGVPFEFEFLVCAQRELDGCYRITRCETAPAADDKGHAAMCAALDDRSAFLETVRTFALPVGKTLDEMIQWSPDASPAGCLCTPASQNHKWRIVLQTLHFALNGNQADLNPKDP